MRKFVNTWIFNGGSTPRTLSDPTLYLSAVVAFERNPNRTETVEIEVPDGTAPKALGGLTADELRRQFPIPAATADQVTVGDLNSTARGTGARKSAGKPDWSQLPWWVVDTIFKTWKRLSIRNSSRGTLDVINLMADWQHGRDSALDEAAALLLEIIHAPAGHNKGDPRGDWFPVRAFEPTVRVLEFGAKKYAKGNWAKGMSWSVCFTCTMSHLSKAFQGEENDEESGLPHLAHAMCNIVFLLGYRTLFPEGDDRLPEFKPQEPANE
jgi:hypothetical protein